MRTFLLFVQHDLLFDGSITLSCKPKIGGGWIFATFRIDLNARLCSRIHVSGGGYIFPNVDGDPLLLHYIFCHEVVT